MHDCGSGGVHRRRCLIQQQQPGAAQQHAPQRQQLLLALRQRRSALPQAQTKHPRLELPLLPPLLLLMTLLMCSRGARDSFRGTCLYCRFTAPAAAAGEQRQERLPERHLAQRCRQVSRGVLVQGVQVVAHAASQQKGVLWDHTCRCGRRGRKTAQQADHGQRCGKQWHSLRSAMRQAVEWADLQARHMPARH